MRPVILCVIKNFKVDHLWYYLDPSNAENWHQMGRTYMVGHSYRKAYESYQQAIYRDDRNLVCWLNIGQLFFKINQQRDVLDAYSRGIRLNPYMSELWVSLGELYHNQPEDSLDAYTRALELNSINQVARAKVSQLKIRSRVHCLPLEDLDVTGIEQGGKIDDEISDDISSYKRSVSIIFCMKILNY